MLPTGSKIINDSLFIIYCIIILNSMNCNSSGIGVPQAGPRWKVYTTSNSGLHNNTINNITVAYNQRIWFSTNNGAAYFDHGSWGWIRDSLYNGGDTSLGYIYSYPVYDIIDAKDHAVWFCLPTRVVRFAQFSQTHVWTNYSYPNIKPTQLFTGTANRSNQTPYGEIWIAGINGISRFHQDATETGIWSTYQESDGTTPLPYPDLLVAEDKPDDYSIWFGARYGGAVEVFYNGQGNLQWQAMTPARDPGIGIYSIGFGDIVGGSLTTIWFGRDTDVVVFNTLSQKWTTYSYGTTNGKMPHAQVNAIVTDGVHQRWFGTTQGLVRFNGDTAWTRWTMANSKLPSDTITALRIDAFNNLWIGTPDGIAVYNPDGIAN